MCPLDDDNSFNEKSERHTHTQATLHVSVGDFLILNDAGYHGFSLPSIDRVHQGGRNPIESVTPVPRKNISRDRTQRALFQVLGIFTLRIFWLLLVVADIENRLEAWNKTLSLLCC